jgi:hypothetical protein
MWWMLLILTVEGYRADSIYPTLELCVKQLNNSQGQCIPVEVRPIDYPQLSQEQ